IFAESSPKKTSLAAKPFVADDPRRRGIAPATPNPHSSLPFGPKIVFLNRFCTETVFASFRSPGHFRAQFPSTLRMASS
ncbi:hypothetical protein LINGRAHAP2_LOCUS30752, partial [Linum grandiflorum]